MGEEDVFRGSIDDPPPTERGSVNARRRHYFRKFRGPGKPYNFATPRDFRAAIYGGGIGARQEFLRGRFEGWSSPPIF